MEQKGDQLDKETVSLLCSICQDILKDPVTIPCGHSYCTNCIKTHWDGEDQRKIYSCLQCKETFTSRPVPVNNEMLANLVGELKKTGLQAAPADHGFAGPGDVACDVCTGRKRKALKSCLTCPASYCDDHLQPHYDAPPLKKHKLSNPSKKIQENICSRHGEVMKMFCRTDQRVICYSCPVDKHKGHDTVSAAVERTEKQKALEISRQQIQQRIQDREKDVELLQQRVDDVIRSADKSVEDNEKIFTELIRLLKKRSSDVKQQIRSQQETEVKRLEVHKHQLEKEMNELKTKDAGMRKLSEMEDHVQFLHNYPSVSKRTLSKYASTINVRPLSYFEDVSAAVLELKYELEEILSERWTKSLTASEVDVLLPPQEPKTRAGFLRYSSEITLDPNTANKLLSLSEENRKADGMQKTQSYSDHPDRFTGWCQALSKETLTGRCYWEVEWRGGGVRIAVAYRTIGRTGGSNDCGFGFNNKSCALYCDDSSYHFLFNNVKTPVSGPRFSRIGVYLDHSAGILSFYGVTKTMTLLHRIQTKFTRPLYAGICLCHYSYGVSAEFCKLR